MNESDKLIVEDLRNRIVELEKTVSILLETHPKVKYLVSRNLIRK